MVKINPLSVIGIICGLSFIDSMEAQPTINGKILYRSKWFSPYKNGKSQLSPKYYKSPGVYIIKSKKTNKPVYVGYSANNLKRTLYRHFQKWNHKYQDTTTYDPAKYSVRIYRTGSKTANRYEKYLIDKLKPKDNKLKYPSLFEKGETEQPYNDFFKSVQVTEELPF
jgi:hypothetical protein